MPPDNIGYDPTRFNSSSVGPWVEHARAVIGNIRRLEESISSLSEDLKRVEVALAEMKVIEEMSKKKAISYGATGGLVPMILAILYSLMTGDVP